MPKKIVPRKRTGLKNAKLELNPEKQLQDSLQKIKALRLLLKDNNAMVALLERELWRLRSERGSVGHLLHEDILQMLVAAKNYCSPIINQSQNLDEVTNIISQTITKLKEVHQRIASPPFLLIGFTGVLLELIARLKTEKQTQLIVDRLDEKINALAVTQQYCLYLIFEELFKNIAIHSYAEIAHVAAQIKDATIQIAVWDNGVGFYNDKKIWRDGLYKIKLLTTELRGKMILESSPGMGCQFRAVLPFQISSNSITSDLNHRHQR